MIVSSGIVRKIINLGDEIRKYPEIWQQQALKIFRVINYFAGINIRNFRHRIPGLKLFFQKSAVGIVLINRQIVRELLRKLVRPELVESHIGDILKILKIFHITAVNIAVYGFLLIYKVRKKHFLVKFAEFRNALIVKMILIEKFGDPFFAAAPVLRRFNHAVPDFRLRKVDILVPLKRIGLFIIYIRFINKIRIREHAHKPIPGFVHHRQRHITHQNHTDKAIIPVSVTVFIKVLQHQRDILDRILIFIIKDNAHIGPFVVFRKILRVPKHSLPDTVGLQIVTIFSVPVILKPRIVR